MQSKTVREQLYPHSSKQKTPRKIFFEATSEQEIFDFAKWLEKKLTREEQKSLYNLLRGCCSHTEMALHHNSEKFRLEFDGIFALKDFQTRLYGYHEGVNFIVFHYMKKKKGRLSKSEKEVLRRKYKECKR